MSEFWDDVKRISEQQRRIPKPLRDLADVPNKPLRKAVDVHIDTACVKAANERSRLLEVLVVQAEHCGWDTTDLRLETLRECTMIVASTGDVVPYGLCVVHPPGKRPRIEFFQE